MPVFVLDRRLLGGRFPSANRARVPARLPAERARRCASAAPTSSSARAGRRRSCPRSRASAAPRPCTSPTTSPRSPGRATAGSRRRSTRVARSPGCSSPTTSAQSSRTRSSPRSGARGSSCRAARSTARRARCTSRAGSRSGACPPRRSRRRASRSRPASAPRASGRTAWFADGLDRYEERHDRLAGGTSELSPYLHFGCISPRELEARALERGGEAFARQLAWRDFYAHVLLHNPANTRRAHKPEYDRLEWDDDEELLDAWREGRTGYPVVDAGDAPAARTRAGCTTAGG